MLAVNQNIINFHSRCDCPFHFVIASFLGVLQGKLFTAKGLSTLDVGEVAAGRLHNWLRVGHVWRVRVCAPTAAYRPLSVGAGCVSAWRVHRSGKPPNQSLGELSCRRV